ncbi:major facilitator superfamily domain-containing protein [Diaporthe sp. PMI_573]|nr:major facilitator superfamily domain-containing protein [Diaporthaceae sp. PMI_573]
MASSQESVSWLDMPRKGQLGILFMLRFAEPCVRSSASTYLYFQLKNLDPSLSSGQIVSQSATVSTAYIIGQCLSSLWISKLADSPRYGRKGVLLLGTAASVISSSLLGFTTHFYQLVLLWGLEGVFNGNVATARTVITEIVGDAKFLSRAFVMVTMATTLSTLLSPLMGGQLADLASQYPEKFGNNWFLKKYPYATPAFVNASMLFITFLAIFFFLEETHPQKKGGRDLGLAISRKVLSCFYSQKNQNASYPPSDDDNSTEMEAVPFMKPDDADVEDLNSSDEEDHENHGKKRSRSLTPIPEKSKAPPVLPLRRIWTRNFVLMLIVTAIHDSHIGAYTVLWTNFLSDPPAKGLHDRLPFRFSGGPGMTPAEIGFTLSIVGVCGLPIQFFVYPKVIHKLGALKTWQLFMRGFPIIYSAAPFVAVVSRLTKSATSEHGQPPAVWVLITLIQVVLIFCAVFVTPTALMLTRLVCPHPSALARTNSISYVGSGLGRALGSSLGALVYSYGTSHSFTGLAFWSAAAVGVCTCCMAMACKQGDGHEIWLDGDEE